MHHAPLLRLQAEAWQVSQELHQRSELCRGQPEAKGADMQIVPLHAVHLQAWNLSSAEVGSLMCRGGPSNHQGQMS